MSYYWLFLLAMNVVVVASFLISWVGIPAICSVTSQVFLTVLLLFRAICAGLIFFLVVLPVLRIAVKQVGFKMVLCSCF